MAADGGQSLQGFAIGASGVSILAGTTASTNLGGDAIAQGEFLLRLAPDGSHLNSRGLTGSNLLGRQGVSLNSAGSVILAGKHFDDFNMDFVDLPRPPDGESALIVRFTPSAGSFFADWGSSLYEVEAHSLAADETGGVAVTGYTFFAAEFGGQQLPLLTPIIIRLGSGGQYLWHRAISGPQGDAQSVARTPAGEFVVLGITSAPTVDVGTGPIPAGADRAFLVKFGN